MKKIFIILLFILSLCGCNNETLINENYIDKIVKDKEYTIIDVRTKEEYNELHVKNSINVPIDEISNIDFDKDKIIFVYCKSGNRSNIAYEMLSDLGYTVYDLGGIDDIDLSKVKES